MTTPSPAPGLRAPRAAAWPLALAGAIALAGCAEACDSGRLVEIEGALLADVMGYEEAPGEDEAPTLALMPDQEEVEIPAADVIRVAIDRDVPFGQAIAVIRDIEREGAEAAILVSHRGSVKRFELEDDFEGRAGVELVGYPRGDDLLSCVRPRGGDEAKCSKQPGGQSIDAAATRSLVYEAIEAYDDDRVIVGVPIHWPWADAVRLLDGARTCCRDDRARIELVHLDHRGAPLDEDIDDLGVQEMELGGEGDLDAEGGESARGDDGDGESGGPDRDDPEAASGDGDDPEAASGDDRDGESGGPDGDDPEAASGDEA